MKKISKVDSSRKILQGEIYWADLNPVKGHEQSGYRPVLILQNNILNRNLNTVVVAPITKNINAKGFLTTFFLEKRVSGLEFETIALLFQIRTIDKQRLRKKAGALPTGLLRDLKGQLLAVF